jgi:hypothetical protein
MMVGALGAMTIWFMPIRQVDCLLDSQPMDKQFGVCAQLQRLLGSRLLLRDFYHDQMTTELLYLTELKESFDLVSLQKSLIGTITFSLSAKPPLYRLERVGQTVLVTESGSLRENNDQITAPLVVDSTGLYDSESTSHLFLAQFLVNLGEQRTKISRIELKAIDRIEVEIPSFPLILLELAQDPRLTAARLVVILKELTPREIDLSIRELDLRFDLPVLRTNSSQLDLLQPESTTAGQELIDR